MDDDGPLLGQLTKPPDGDKKRFELEWLLPLEPGLSTHVTLFDLQCFPPHPIAAGQGGDEADALLELWTALPGQHASADAVAYVAEAYSRRTGRCPERPHND